MARSSAWWGATTDAADGHSSARGGKAADAAESDGVEHEGPRDGLHRHVNSADANERRRDEILESAAVEVAAVLRGAKRIQAAFRRAKRRRLRLPGSDSPPSRLRPTAASWSPHVWPGGWASAPPARPRPHVTADGSAHREHDAQRQEAPAGTAGERGEADARGRAATAVQRVARGWAARRRGAKVGAPTPRWAEVAAAASTMAWPPSTALQRQQQERSRRQQATGEREREREQERERRQRTRPPLRPEQEQRQQGGAAPPAARATRGSRRRSSSSSPRRPCFTPPANLFELLEEEDRDSSDAVDGALALGREARGRKSGEALAHARVAQHSVRREPSASTMAAQTGDKAQSGEPRGRVAKTLETPCESQGSSLRTSSVPCEHRHALSATTDARASSDRDCEATEPRRGSSQGRAAGVGAEDCAGAGFALCTLMALGMARTVEDVAPGFEALEPAMADAYASAASASADAEQPAPPYGGGGGSPRPSEVEAEISADEDDECGRGSGASDGEAAPPPLFFYSHRANRVGEAKACLSNWFPCRFLDDLGREFTSSEQFMMHRKALLFNDTASAERILATSNPAEAQRLGRQVRGYDDARWAKHARTFVEDGIFRKFMQNEHLGVHLEATGERLLVECSPTDGRWGIKADAGAAAAMSEAELARRALDGNWLGHCLMRARARLRLRRRVAEHDEPLPLCATVRYQRLADLLERLLAVPLEERPVVCSKTGARWDDAELVELLRAFPERGGFPADPTHVLPEAREQNGKMDVEQIKAAYTLLRAELDRGWVKKFATRAAVPHHVIKESPIFLVPKRHNGAQKTKDQQVDLIEGLVRDGVPSWRWVDHASYPEGGSLNDATSMSVPCTLDDVPYASQLIMSLRTADGTLSDADKRRVELFKLDLESAYRMWPIAKDSRHLFYFRFLDPDKPIPQYVQDGGQPRDEDMVYFEKQVLSFGWVRSVEYFVRVSKSVKALALWTDCPGLEAHFVPRDKQELCVYVDDFLSLTVGGWGQRAKDRLLALCSLLDLPVSEEKLATEGAVELLKEFLGITLSPETESMFLSPERVSEGLARLRAAAGKRVMLRKDFASLVGVLSFAASCCPAGRTFMRRLWDRLKWSRGKRRVRLGRGVRLDLDWWLRFWEQYNGKSLSLDAFETTAEELSLWTDASFSGFGACFMTPDGPQYFGGRWSDYGLNPKAEGFHISELEACAVALAMDLWGKYLSQRRIVMRCDNEATVHMINTGRCKDPGMMCSMRSLFFTMAKHSFAMNSKHVKTEDNVLADSASRWFDDPKYREVFFKFARDEFGFERDEMTQVTPTLDIAELLRKIKKARAAAARHELARNKRAARTARRAAA